MSKGIILYQSKYGSAEKYARWLQEETGFDCMETKKAKISGLKAYDTIVLGGGVYASGIAGLGFLKRNIASLRDKKLAVFAAGASPYDEKAIDQIKQLHFMKELAGIPLFYCRGAWNEEIMTTGDRMLCRLLKKAVAKQDPETYEPWQKALMEAIGKSCDWTDKDYLRPLLEYLENGSE